MINPIFTHGLLRSSALLLGLGLATPSLASVPITVASYDTPNGDGQASGGTYNYWDLAYSGVGTTNVDGAPLSGGSGDLTNGIVAADFWYNVENGAGTGPYVGWYTVSTLNPTVAFTLLNYADPGAYFDVQQIDIHIDNSRVGGVFAPAAILVNGAPVAFTAPAPGTIGWISLTGFAGVTSLSPVNVQFIQDSGWVFVSEVQFSGTFVPEPASWAMLIAGFGLVGGTLRRQRMLEA